MFQKIIRPSLILIFIFSHLQLSAQFELWTVGTGKTIHEGNLEVSIFRPARYGITRTLEVSAHPLAFFVLPHAQVKKNWYDREISVATIHGLNYPTIFLNIVRKRNNENLIPIDSVVPQLFAFKNEVIVSKMLKEATSCEAGNYLLSLKLGFQFALKFGNSTLPYIEKPIIFQRTSIYHDKLLWYVGADLDAHLNSFINYSVDVDFLSIGFDIEDWAIEHKGMIMWKFTNSLMALIGYKISYGTYHGNPGIGIYPMADISWTYKFKLKKEKQLNLFQNGKNY